MHRLVMGLHKKRIPFIDHIDRNGLNNQKSNLRICNQSTNQQNTGLNSRNVTGFKGVSLYTIGCNAGKYVVSLKANGKRYHGGYFKDPLMAAKKYNEMAKKIQGEFAFLNKL